MTISLGLRLPRISGDLPEGRWRVEPTRAAESSFRTNPRLPSYLVLLPVGFTKPSRSPDLLVSSYLTVSPLPAKAFADPRRRSIFCGTFPALAGGGRYPPRKLDGARTFLTDAKFYALAEAGTQTPTGAVISATANIQTLLCGSWRFCSMESGGIKKKPGNITIREKLEFIYLFFVYRLY